MMGLIGHSKAKYVTGECLGTSSGRGWRGLLAERWRHGAGDLGSTVPRDTEVIVMLEGQLRVRRRGAGRLQHHDAVAGSVWLCPAGIAEDMIHLSGNILDSVHLYLPAQPLSLACLQELGLDPARVELRYEGGFRDPVIETIARTIATELRDANPIGSVLVETMSAALGVYLVRQFSNRDLDKMALPSTRGVLSGARLRRVLGLIEARLDDELSLAELAHEASLSPFHFARCFKAATGTSPHRYLIERRLERARVLLKQGSPALAEIAAACGFCSQAHFNQAFKRATGVAPGMFRATWRAVA